MMESRDPPDNRILCGTVFVGSYESWAPPVWSFSQPATATMDPSLVPTHFHCSRPTSASLYLRFGYTTDDARSLIEYLNGRDRS